MSHNLSSCIPPRARKVIVSLLMTLLVGQHMRQVFSVLIACINNSDYEILAALQTVETVVRTQRYRLDVDKFPMFSVGWTWQCRDLDPCGFE